MSVNRFIQIHWLISYPGALINRDEAGLGKRLPFGDSVRGRISSQCIKRHLRLAGGRQLDDATKNEWAIQASDVPCGKRTKVLVEDLVMPKAREKTEKNGQVDQEICDAIQESMIVKLYGDKAKDLKARQALFFGEPEVAYLIEVAVNAFSLKDVKEVEKFFKNKDLRENMRALAHGAGLESALFGRMVTSDPQSNRDAAFHISHAITVHPIARELDYVTAVDDLKSKERGDDSGAAGIFDAELTSGLYYGYAVIDSALLLKNLASDKVVAADVVRRLIHLIAQVSPGAKKGSTAPYSWAEFMLVESGSRQPRTLANAFREAVPLKSKDVLAESIKRMETYLKALDSAYGAGEERRQLSMPTKLAEIEPIALDKLADWAGEQLPSA